MVKNARHCRVFKSRLHDWVGVYSDVYLVATILSQSEDLVGVKICGAICGAITNEFSAEAERHAYMYYQEIREMSTDIQRIAKFTGIDEKIIAEIKNYVLWNIMN